MVHTQCFTNVTAHFQIHIACCFLKNICISVCEKCLPCQMLVWSSTTIFIITPRLLIKFSSYLVIFWLQPWMIAYFDGSTIISLQICLSLTFSMSYPYYSTHLITLPMLTLNICNACCLLFCSNVIVFHVFIYRNAMQIMMDKLCLYMHAFQPPN